MEVGKKQVLEGLILPGFWLAQRHTPSGSLGAACVLVTQERC